MGSNTSRPAKYDTPAYGCLITFLVLTTIAIVARGTSRRLVKAPFWADDGLAILAYVSNAASLINENTMATVGAFDLSRLMLYTPEDTASFQKRNLASAVLYLITITSAKLSVLFLFRRVFYVHQGWFKAAWWFNFLFIFPCWTGATLGLLIYAQIDTFAFTKPANAYGSSVCALANAISDIMVLTLPISSVMKLQLGRAQKIGVIGLFSLGLLTTLVSLARATISFHQARQGPGQWNPAYQTYNYMMLVGAETSAAVLCACIPVARPFFLKAGQIASRSLNTSSLRAFISKTSLSSQSNKSDTYGSLSGDITKKDTISRSVEVDVDSIPLRQTSANQSFERANTLGYAEHRDPPASATAWA